MWCDAQFSKFDTRIKLDKGRRDRIESALRAFADLCQRDAELRSALAEAPFLQGSVPTNTAVRPLGNDEYDVDVIYPFKLAVFQNRGPKAIFDWFKARLNQAQYQGKMDIKNRCIRINFAGDFHMDIIPSTADVPAHRPYAVPARDLMDWITNDPRGLVTWIKAKDQQSGMIDADGDGVFVRSVRIMKRWRDQFFGSDPRPSSILLTTILGKHEASQKNYNPPLAQPLYPEYRCVAAYLYDLLRLTSGCLQNSNLTPFNHPTITTEDLRRGWDPDFTRRFLERLNATVGYLKDGIWAATDAASAAAYQRAFGETFPLE